MNRASLVGDLMDALARDGRARVTGFGTFVLTPVPPRPGVNPGTGAPVQLGPQIRVTFKPFRSFKSAIGNPPSMGPRDVAF